MRTRIAFILLWLTTLSFGQKIETMIKGSITFRSAQNVYVAFDNTEGIVVGDSLFMEVKGWDVPILLVKSLSSTSCLCTLLSNQVLDGSSFILAKIPTKQEKPSEHQTAKDLEAAKPVNAEIIGSLTQTKLPIKPMPKFDGRISLTSYSNISANASNQRLRYNLSFNAQNIDSSAFSAEAYVSFSHRLNEWKGINDALKVYSLAVNYRAGEHSSLSLGRKINVNMANIGAVDGLQYEYNHRSMTYGFLTGFRPDYYDYSFNPNLLQVGAFVSHTLQTMKGNMQTSLAIFDQMNQFNTDRQFAYLQHSNALLKNLYLFASMEVDFYTMVNMQPKSTFDLTSTYISLRYKPVKNLSLSLSYDARKNIYYYETFKNQIDSILDRETRQGLRFNFNYKPFNMLVWGGNAGYRYKKTDVSPSVNANTFLSYRELPFLKTYTTLDVTYLKTGYLDGMVYGISFSKDLLEGKLYSEFKYRLVNYQYANSASTLMQNIGECSFSWRLDKKLMLSVDMEGTLESNGNSARVYLNITRRF